MSWTGLKKSCDLLTYHDRTSLIERYNGEISLSRQAELAGILTKNEIQISMDSRGRCMDNIFTERLWRTVKYENVYLKSYPNFSEANSGLKIYFNFYNNDRPHSALGNKTPAQVYFKNRIS